METLTATKTVFAKPWPHRSFANNYAQTTGKHWAV